MRITFALTVLRPGVGRADVAVERCLQCLVRNDLLQLGLSGNEVRIDDEHVAEGAGGFPIPLLSAVHQPQVIVGVGFRQGCPKADQRFVESPQLALDDSLVDVGAGEIRPDANRVRQLPLRVSPTAAQHQLEAEVVPQDGVIGFELHGAGQRLERLLALTCQAQQQAEAMIRLRVVVLDRDGLAILMDRLGEQTLGFEQACRREVRLGEDAGHLQVLGIGELRVGRRRPGFPARRQIPGPCRLHRGPAVTAGAPGCVERRQCQSDP